MEILKPFGPPIYKSNLDIKDIEKINSYLENNLLNDDDKKKKTWCKQFFGWEG